MSTKCWPFTHMAQNWALREGFQGLLKMKGRKEKEKREEEKKVSNPICVCSKSGQKTRYSPFFKLFLPY